MPSPELLEQRENAGSVKHGQPSDGHYHHLLLRQSDAVAELDHSLSPLTLNPQQPPRHPISCMQGAFEESIMEYTAESFGYIKDRLDSHARRQHLLEEETFDEGYSPRWRQKPGSKFHPLWKLIAQISFGIHLLHQRTAKSDHEVVKILQTHVDEIDSFLEDTMADFDLAISDIEERIEYLIMPLHNGRTFEQMLADRIFRGAILDGNDVIERIISRTAGAMSGALDDVSNGLEGTAELAKYLDRLGSEWTQDNESLRAVYAAMRANAEGWYVCFKSIQLKGEHLKLQCSVLQSTVSEVARRCGMVSRRGQSSRSRKSHRQTSSESSKAPLSASRLPSFDKPLPPDPLTKALAARLSHQASFGSIPSEYTNMSSSTRMSNSDSRGSHSAQTSITHATNSPMTTNELKSTISMDTGSLKATSSSSQLGASLPTNQAPNNTTGPPSSTQSTMGDSAYSSCSSSVANSPKNILQIKSLKSIATPASQIGGPSPIPIAHRASLTALPSILDADNPKEQHTSKGGLGSLKVLFAKRQTVRERSSKAALGGHVQF